MNRSTQPFTIQQRPAIENVLYCSSLFSTVHGVLHSIKTNKIISKAYYHNVSKYHRPV